VHASGVPFTDASGDRLRTWMGVASDEFYDVERVAIVPMGFCFPGLDRHGADLPPRNECAPLWREKVLGALPNVELVLLVGSYAQRWHLPSARGRNMTDIVQGWRELPVAAGEKRSIPLPHPSWRNNAWIKRHPWFEAELLPELRREVRRLLGPAPRQRVGVVPVRSK
jgi:uracil-DNA glycosylase